MRGTEVIQAKHIKAVLLDLDGTLYFKGKLLPQAAQAVDALRESGRRLRFLTNTDSKSTATLQRELAAMGLNVEEDEVFSAASAALQFLHEHRPKRCYCLVSPELAPAFAPYHANVGAVDYVVVGDCRETVTYAALNTAFRHLMAGAEILALQKGRYFVTEDGYNVDTGAFVQLLEYASGKTATVLGKPSAEFFAAANRQVHCSPDEVVVVGDDVATDTAGAEAVGALSVRVRTGKYAQEALDRSAARADYVVDSIADVPQLISTIAK